MRAVLLAVLLLGCVRKEPTPRERLDVLETKILERLEELKLAARRYDSLDECLERKFDGPDSPVASEQGARMAVLTCRTLARHAR